MSADVITCSKIIAIHSLQSKQPIVSFTHHRGIVNCVSVNHTNKVIASCGQDGKIFMSTVEKPMEKLLQKNFYPNFKEKPSSLSSCAFSPNSRYIAAGSVDSIVKLWDLRGDKNAEKERDVIQIKSHMCGVTSLAWIKNLRSESIGGELLASASSSGDLFLHSNKAGVFQEAMSLKLQEGINCVRVSESMDYCRMAACTNGGTLAVWDLMSGKNVPIWTTSSSSESKASMTSLSISAYSPVLLVTASVDETLTFYDIQQKKSVKKITAEQPLSCVGLHSNGHILVAGGMYGNTFVYDLRNPSKPQTKLAGHETTIKHLQFFRFKEKDPAESKSKAPSIVSINSSSSLPPPTVEQKSQFVGVSSGTSGQSELRSKENIKLPEAKTNNFINAPTQRVPVVEEVSKQKKIQQKLSVTGQQLMKNQATSRVEIVSGLSQTGGSQNFRHRSRESRTQIYDQQALRDAGELRQMKQKMVELQRELKQVHNDMFQMQQRLNMSMIRQFQLHQSEMRQMLSSFFSRQKQKAEYIKKLQTENERLKNSSF